MNTHSSNQIPPGSQHPSIVPAIIGFALAGGLILGLGLWTAKRRSAPAHEPQVTLIQPTRDTTVTGPLTLVFQPSLELKLQPTGWGNGRYHLHALVNGTELMPAAADIRAVGTGRYAWILPQMPDSAELRLIWALPNHRRLPQGGSQTILVRTRL